MTTLREILDKRKEDDKPLEYGPPKGRKWGRHRKRAFRDHHGEQYPGEYYGTQLHYKNAAARKQYRAGLDAIVATGVEGEALQSAMEDLAHHYCKTVIIFYNYNNQVRKMLRSAQRREARDATEHGSGDSAGTPTDNPAGANA